MIDVQAGDTIVLISPGTSDEKYVVRQVRDNSIIQIRINDGPVDLIPKEYRVIKQAPWTDYKEGYYIKLPNMEASLAAIRALIEDGAQFKVTASGPTASVTIYNGRDRDILERFR